MRRIAVLTPPVDGEYAAAARKYLEPYRAPFAARGLELVELPWPDAVGRPPDVVATLALFAWGYHFDVVQWEGILAAWPPGHPVFNSPALMAWNTRKTYLVELAARGIPVVPSRFGRADASNVAAAFAQFECAELVVKPQVSAGSWQTQRLRPGDPVAPTADAILQPFLPAIGGEGELSFLFIGGRFSHAVRKVAAADEFRIQPQFGGAFSRFDPDPADQALAERVIAAAPAQPLYARVDLIRLPDGTLALMELEVIEPDLYLDHGDDVAGQLADALLERLVQ